MKSIILFRHGKSDWYSNYSRDLNRPLNERGKKSAKMMGNYLATINEIPEKIICSTSLRTKSTAFLAIKKGNWNSQLELNENIYNSSKAIFFSIIKKQSPTIKKICIVGHEPSLSSFINQTTNSRIMKFPTAAMARIDFVSDIWEKINFMNGKLIWLKKPKEIC